MELVVTGVALQVLALALLAVLAYDDQTGRVLRVRVREDGRTDTGRDEAEEQWRRQLFRGLLGLFVGGTMLALLGLPRL